MSAGTVRGFGDVSEAGRARRLANLAGPTPDDSVSPPMPHDRPFSTSAFDYSYPPELIAQRPLPDRSASRLLLLERATGAIHHRTFRDLPSLFETGDVLVRNTSKVMPARLTGRRDNGREAEVLLVHAEPDGTWLAMVHPGGKLKTGRTLRFGEDTVAEVVEVLGGGLRRLRFTGLAVEDLMERFGTVPLPPYIERAPEPADGERYQTVYAKAQGSVAAPTAGLHFTKELLDAIRASGVAIADITLHVGPGTFKPVEVEDPAEHRLHAEWYELSSENLETIRRGKLDGGRVWAVGTTAARVLETVASPPVSLSRSRERRDVEGIAGWTDLFIHPPYEFKLVDALLTNFHLPRSTLIMLVAAFAGYEHTMRAYREAVAQHYRLYSYGDAMVVV